MSAQVVKKPAKCSIAERPDASLPLTQNGVQAPLPRLAALSGTYLRIEKTPDGHFFR